jgi:hypothetical protein
MAKLLAFVFLLFGFVTLGTPVGAQSAADCPNNTSAPTIAGNYTDNFGYLQSISAPFWLSGTFLFEVCSVDETKHAIVARNNERNPYEPNKYSRFEWTESGNRLWYCQSVFNAASAADATAVTPADASNPAQGGCGGAPWSNLIEILPPPPSPGS